MPNAVRITVLRRAFYPELADRYLSEGRSVGPCPILLEDQTFLYEGGAEMPAGFCPWAWIDIYRACATLNAGGFDNQWYAQGHIRVECCTDGIRPVTFLLEAVAEHAAP